MGRRITEVHKLINSVEIRKNCQGNGRNLLLYVFVRRVIKLTAVIIEEYHCYQLHTKVCLNIFLSRLTKLLGIISVDFSVINQLLIRQTDLWWGLLLSLSQQYMP
jgi:hypothetical protein